MKVNLYGHEKNKIQTNLFGKLILVVLFGGIILTSSGNEDDIKPLLDVFITLVSIPVEGGTSNIIVTSNDQWSIISNSAFSLLQLNQTSGSSGSSEIQLTAGPNATGSTRSTILNVSSQNGQARRISVSQVSQVSQIDTIAHDCNFYIFLCFGQSNMHGVAPIESQDKIVDSRFKVFQTLDCADLNRKKATWYTAVPPSCQCYSGLSPTGYFGRTMVANLPDIITVGIINVSVAGCDISLFYMDYDSTSTDNWLTSQVIGYDGNTRKFTFIPSRTIN